MMHPQSSETKVPSRETTIRCKEAKSMRLSASAYGDGWLQVAPDEMTNIDTSLVLKRLFCDPDTR